MAATERATAPLAVPRVRVSASATVLLFMSVFTSQAAVLVLSPILVDVARDLHVSTAVAGQLRVFAAPVALVVAVLGCALGRTVPVAVLVVADGVRRCRITRERRGAVVCRARACSGAAVDRRRRPRRGRRRRGRIMEHTGDAESRRRARIGRRTGGLDRWHARDRTGRGHQLASRLPCCSAARSCR